VVRKQINTPNALISRHSEPHSYTIFGGPTVLISSLAILENAALSILPGEEPIEAL